MHHDARRRALGVEHVKNVVVSVAIMDDEGFVEGLGEGDVRRKCVPLHGLASSIGCSVVIQPGLPDGSYAQMLGQRLHQFKAWHQVRSHARGIVWMNRNAGDH